MAVDRRLIIPGVCNKVPEACYFVVQAAEAARLDERSVYYCQMAVDEWCTNIIEHGYGEHIGPKDDEPRIEITCVSGPNTLTIMISDNSIPFDPTQLSYVEPSQLLYERKPDGMVWVFISRIIDVYTYEFSATP